ncbi:MAG: tetratricopeptide repeat protein [Pseudomonadota bacterium]
MPTLMTLKTKQKPSWMRLKKIYSDLSLSPLAALLSLILLSGCAPQTAVVETSVTPVVDDEGLAPLVTNTGDILGTVENAERFNADDDTLYQLLVAEFAGQRGRLELAVDKYLAAAKTQNSVDIAERAARIAVFARQNDAAIEAAKIWTSLTPTAVDARQILAAMYIRSGNAEGARKELETVLSSRGEEQDTRLRMIVNLLGREQDKQTALTVMEKLLETRGDHLEANVAHALLAIRAEEIDTAKYALKRVAELEALDANLAVAFVSLLEKHNRTPEAISWLKSQVESRPDNGIRMVYARLLADAGQYDVAREQFLILTKDSPTNSDVIYALGLLNLQAERIDEAQTQFQKLVKLDVRKDDAKFYLGQIHESKGESKAAIADYRNVTGGQNFFMAQVRVALILANENDIAGARAQIKSIRAEDAAQEKQLLNTEAEILAQNGEYAKAMAIYDEALEEGYDMELLYTRAMLAEQMDRIDILERDLRHIIEREPQNSQALNALGYTLADRTERFDEALALLEKALALSPNDFYILDSMGWVMYRLGRFEESIEYLYKAREIRDDPEVAAHLGEVLWVMGNKDEARTLLQNAIQDTPDDERLLELIRKLESES